jgi:hypothetical protein
MMARGLVMLTMIVVIMIMVILTVIISEIGIVILPRPWRGACVRIRPMGRRIPCHCLSMRASNVDGTVST